MFPPSPEATQRKTIYSFLVNDSVYILSAFLKISSMFAEEFCYSLKMAVVPPSTQLKFTIHGFFQLKRSMSMLSLQRIKLFGHVKQENMNSFTTFWEKDCSGRPILCKYGFISRKGLRTDLDKSQIKVNRAKKRWVKNQGYRYILGLIRARISIMESLGDKVFKDGKPFLLQHPIH